MNKTQGKKPLTAEEKSKLLKAADEARERCSKRRRRSRRSQAPLPSLSQALTWLHIRTRTLEEIYRNHEGTTAARLAASALTCGPDGTTLIRMANAALDQAAESANKKVSDGHE